MSAIKLLNQGADPDLVQSILGDRIDLKQLMAKHGQKQRGQKTDVGYEINSIYSNSIFSHNWQGNSM